MAIISGDRESRRLFPASIEDYVGQEDPVRVYDLFVDKLDFKELDIDCTELRVGAPNYDPRAMLKLWVYGISYGFRSPRKLERACNHNVSFMWLLCGLTPDFKTISEFRRNNVDALKKVLFLCGRLCIRMKLIEGNVLFVDGSKFRANANINKFWTDDKCKKVTVCADGGYHQIEDLKKLHDDGKQVVVPSRKQSSRKGLPPFDRENFVYDESQNEYICPEGHRLKYKRFVKGHNAYEYIIASKKNCISCKFGECTKSKQGRCVQRSVNEELKEKLEKVYDSPECQEIYERRKERTELPFGHLKRNLGADYFLLRGLKGVNAEMSLLCTSFNIRRMISLLGVPTLPGLSGGS